MDDGERSSALALQLSRAIGDVRPDRVVYVDFDVADAADMLLLQAAFQLARRHLGNIEQSITTQDLFEKTCRAQSVPGSENYHCTTLVFSRCGAIGSVVRGTYREFSFSTLLEENESAEVSPILQSGQSEWEGRESYVEKLVWGFELSTSQKRILKLDSTQHARYLRTHVAMHYSGILSESAVTYSAHYCVQSNEALRSEMRNCCSPDVEQQILPGTQAHVHLQQQRAVLPIENGCTSSTLQHPVLIHLFSLENHAIPITSLHHIIADSVSVSELCSQLADYYHMYVLTKASHTQSILKYWHLIEYEREYEQTGTYSASKTFWDTHLTGYEVTKLPADVLHPKAGHGVQRIHFRCLVANFKRDLIPRPDLTPRIMGVWFCMLSNMCASSTILLGLVVHGRPTEFSSYVDQIIGCFANIVAVRIQWIYENGSESRFMQFIAEEIAQCLEHSRIPFEGATQCITSAEQICPFLLNYGTDLDSSQVHVNGNEGGDTVTAIGSMSATHDIVLNANVYEERHTLNGVLQHSSSFYANTIKYLLFNQCQLLQNCVNSTVHVSSYFGETGQSFSSKLTNQNEEGCVIQSDSVCNNYQLSNGTQHFRFNRSVTSATSLGRLAVFAGCRVRSNHQICFGHIAGQEAYFCCLLKRSVFQFLGCIASLLASMVYVPLDASDPKSRKCQNLPNCNATESVCYAADKFYSVNKHTPRIRATPSDIFYVIFTSGSTGLPKGVCITRSAYSQTTSNSILVAKSEPFALMIQYCSFIFDPSLMDFCFFLANRCSLVFLQNTNELVYTTKTESIHSYVLVTNVANRMTKHELQVLCSKLSKLLIGGETLHNAAVQQACSQEMQVIGLYGPTELTIFSTAKQLGIFDIGNNIGKPSVGEFAVIFDDSERPSNTGLLSFSGSSVARGYISRPNQTAELFKVNSLCSVEQTHKREHQISYVTGDAAKFLPDGDIYYLGRLDTQIKLYGYRVEVSEIEQQMMNLSFIDNCCVVSSVKNEHCTLAAFYVASDACNEADIKMALGAVLPAFKIPRMYFQLQDMPSTLTGKIDRKKLASICESAIHNVSPATKTECHAQSLEVKLCAIWCDVLNIENVNRRDDFFLIGGTSLDIIKLWNAYQIAGLSISWSKTKQLSRMEKLLEYLGNESQMKTKPSERFRLMNTNILIPPIWGFELTTPQKRIWLFEQMRQQIFWRAEVYMHYSGILWGLAVMASAQHCVQVNDCLRCSIPTASEMSVNITVLSGTEAHINLLMDRAAKCSIACESAGLLQQPVLILRLLSINDHTVLFNSLHHIIMDAVSVSEFYSQLADFYQMYLRAIMSYEWLTAKYWHFMEYERVITQTDVYAASLTFWNEYLADYEVVKLPVDVSDKPVMQENVTLHFSCQSMHCFPDPLPKLMGAWFHMLSNMCASAEILVGLPVYGRPAEILHIDKVIGCFINIALIRLKRDQLYCTEGMFLQTIVDEIAKCLDNSRIPYEQMVQCISSAEQTSPLLLNYVSIANLHHALFAGTLGNSTVTTIGSGISSLHDIVLNANTVKESHTIYGTMLHNRKFYSDNMKYLLLNQYQLIFTLFGGSNNSLNPRSKYGQKLEHSSSKCLLPPEKSCPVQSETVCSNCQLYRGTHQFRVDQSAVSVATLARYATDTGCRVSSAYQTHVGQSVGQEAAFCCQLKRNILQFLGCVASLLTSMIYVPLDYNYPISRKQYILEQCGATESVCYAADRLYSVTSAPLIKSVPSDLAYVLFTSGSTGLPKGACISRSSYSQTVANMIQIAKAQPFSLMLQHSRYIFDSSMLDFCFYMANCCSLIVLEHSHNLADVSREENIEYSFFVTNVLNRMAKDEVQLLGNKLSKLIVGGESLHNQAIKLACTHEMQLISIYGPTEATICSTTKQFRNSDVGNDIGTTNLGEFIVMLDFTEKPSYNGILTISGSSVGRGYISKPSLTKNVFKTNCVCSVEQRNKLIHKISYSTGDAAKFLPDGNVYYLGRRDSQIKLYGYRIEMSEIEQQLMKLAYISNCCIVHTVKNEHGTLVAFYVAIDSQKVDEAQIKKDLSAVLPAYMVPRKFIQLQEMPSTASGKIDRKQLEAQGKSEIDKSELDNDSSDICQTSNEGDTSAAFYEEKITAIWCELLNIEQVARDDDFFLMGGTSLDVITLWSMYRSAGIDISLSKTHQCSTVQKLINYLCEPSASERQVTHQQIPSIQGNVKAQEIAIVGSAGMFSNTRSIRELWQEVVHGETDCITRSAVHNSASFIAAVGHMPDATLFDPQFWDMAKSDADIIDPQIRKLLVCGFHAIENSGLGQCLNDHTIAAYMGCGHNTYYDELMEQDHDSLASWKLMHLNEFFTPATMFSFKLGLTGAAIGLNTACSTSLVALYAACQALHNGECDTAIAGGSAFPLPSMNGYAYVADGIASNDGYCRPFDARATGTLPGAGVVCAVVQKRSSCGGNPLAIIRAIAVNNDGFRAGYTKPKVEGQQRCIQKAIADARTHPSEISFVECHGTGTFIGDPIEIQALHAAHSAFGPPERNCILGSIKANLGHPDCAAGLVGVAKICKMFQERLIPPQIHFQTLNPHLSEFMQGYSISTCVRQWNTSADHRCAGISSFGIGGTNSHAILAEYNADSSNDAVKQQSAIVPLSAKSETSLENLKGKLTEYLQTNGCKDPVCLMAHLTRGRNRFAYKAACFTCPSGLSPFVNGRMASVEQRAEPLAFIYPGQGLHVKDLLLTTKQYELLPEYNKVMSKCMTELTAITGIHVSRLTSTLVDGNIQRAILSRTEWLQPLVASVETALTIQLQKWAFSVDLSVGHSLGEYAALFVAGVFPQRNELLQFVQTRARLMQQTADGRMLAVSQRSLAQLNTVPIRKIRFLTAAVNQSELLTLSGSTAAITYIVHKLRKVNKNSRFTLLPTDKAFHSSLMEPILSSFGEAVYFLELHMPHNVTPLSNVSGRCFSSGEAVNPDYFMCHARHAVQFRKCTEYVQRLDSGKVLVEVGPGKMCTQLLKASPLVVVPTLAMNLNMSMQSPSSFTDSAPLGFLCNLWVNGVELPWEHIFPQMMSAHRNNTESIPNYIFDDIECWMPASDRFKSKRLPLEQPTNSNVDYYIPIWTSNIVHRFEKLDEGIRPKFMVISGGIEAEHIIRIVQNCGNAVIKAEFGCISQSENLPESDERRRQISDVLDLTNKYPMNEKPEHHPDIVLFITETTLTEQKPFRMSKLQILLSLVHHNILTFCAKKTAFYALCLHPEVHGPPLDVGALSEMVAINKGSPHVNTTIIDVKRHEFPQLASVLFSEMIFNYWNQAEPTYVSIDDGYLHRQRMKTVLGEARAEMERETREIDDLDDVTNDDLMHTHIHYLNTVAMISTAFSEVLGTSNNSVQSDSSFFDLGGTSLSGIQLVERLKDMLNCELNLNDLLNSGSPSALAQVVLRTDKSAANQALIPLKPSMGDNASICVVIIHAAGGCLFHARVFCDIMPESCAYYGIQYPDTLTEAHEEVAEVDLHSLAAHYVSKLLEVTTADKRLILMGASLGGTVAYEMQAQLVFHHQFPAPPVIAFDSWAKFPANLIDKIDGEIRDNHTCRIAGQLADGQSQAQQAPGALVGAIVTTTVRLMIMLLKYEVKPHGAIGNTLYLFKSAVLDELHRSIDELEGNSADNYWEELADCEVSTAEVNCDHYSILEEEHVGPIKVMVTNVIRELRLLSF